MLKNFSYDRYWAQKQGKKPTPAVAADVVVVAEGAVAAEAAGVKFVGGTKSLEELIAGCERGILVTHFFYIELARSANGAAHGPHARRHVPDREGQDHAGR